MSTTIFSFKTQSDVEIYIAPRIAQYDTYRSTKTRLNN